MTWPGDLLRLMDQTRYVAVSFVMDGMRSFSADEHGKKWTTDFGEAWQFTECHRALKAAEQRHGWVAPWLELQVLEMAE
jgi:hypothetical protein